MEIDRGALRVARAVARELAGRGALAVVLTGSHARGEAHDASDVDLMAVVSSKRDADALAPPILRRGGHTVTIARRTRAGFRARLYDPNFAPTRVPGWREAIILHDPKGVAVRLQREAQRWTWESIAAACDEYVAREITGYAEEVHKLAGMVAARQSHGAAVQRSVIALRMAGIMAVHRRILYGTENILWDAVAEAMGEPWASAQSRALSEGGESLDASCRAALALYAMAAAEARPLLDRTQRAVVDAACALAT